MADHSKEMADRLRRIETRLVKFFEHYGFDTERKLPTVTDGAMDIPSMEVSLNDMIAALPKSHYKVPIAVIHKGVFVAQIIFPPNLEVHSGQTRSPDPDT